MTAWKVVFEKNAAKELKRLDKQHAKRILTFLFERIAGTEDPKKYGEALQHDLSGLWRYRIGDYRVICDIRENILTVYVVRIGHRRKVYRK